MKKSIFSAICVALATLTAGAQTGADFMKAMKKADVNISFDVTDPGIEYKVNWGMDAAWDWDWNVTRGINFIGVGNFGTGRISFQPNDLVKDNGDGTYTLTARQQKKLKWRCDLIKGTGTKEVNINCDHEALFTDENGNEDFTGRTNYQGKPEEWYKLIKASVQYAEGQGLKVVSISPFNEPDYVWQQAKDETQAMKDFLAIAKLLKADEYFKDIRICGGNTLNCDRALPWYNYLKDYLDEGNTHQLAGSFDNYANFFSTVRNEGKVATADELHNVGEAFVGVHYGMTNGIWWGFESLARGQYCLDANEGAEIGYAENRSAWTDAAVYRNNRTGEVHGYVGSSERQASTSSFAFVSTTKDVYFNGYGPTRMFVYDLPGGNGYQKGQINAERVFDITWGEDVAPGVIDGTYMIVNAMSGKMLTWRGSDNVQTTNFSASSTSQQWKVYPGYTSHDISYWFIDNATPGEEKVNLNVKDNNINAGAGVICWNADHGKVEQWYLKYAQDGYYYIISNISNKYLYCSSSSSGTNITLQDGPAEDAKLATKKRYFWRFQPTDSKADTRAPNVPTDLVARQRTGSIELSWTAPLTTSSIDGAESYIILRGETVSTEEGETIEWNTIGRGSAETTFTDNTALTGKNYSYKVIAVDKAGNRSQASEVVAARRLEKNALICQLQFDNSLGDNTANKSDMSLYGTEKYSTGESMRRSGSSALNLNGSSQQGTSYGMLPYTVADTDDMTITMWVRWDAKNGAWARIFDFGNDEKHYMYLTPSNGTEMRFVMKNGGDEEILGTGSKLATVTVWKHIAVTIKSLDAEKVRAVIYVDGKVVAESDEFTIKPSDIRPSLCFIGRSIFNADPVFCGYMDDLRIYNYALSAEEVKGVMEDTEVMSKDINDEYEEVTTGIRNVGDGDSDSDGYGDGYDLSGRRVSTSTKGIVIKNKQKYLRK